MSIVTATIVVDFQNPADAGAAGSGLLKLEIDSREDGLNGGKTSFRPGDPVHYLLFKSSNVSITDHETTAGGHFQVETGTFEHTETLTFINAAEASLAYPLASGLSVDWQGDSGGAVTGTVGSDKILLPSEALAVAEVTYNTQYTAFRLSGVAEDITTVLIYVEGEAS